MNYLCNLPHLSKTHSLWSTSKEEESLTRLELALKIAHGRIQTFSSLETSLHPLFDLPNLGPVEFNAAQNALPCLRPPILLAPRLLDGAPLRSQIFRQRSHHLQLGFKK